MTRTLPQPGEIVKHGEEPGGNGPTSPPVWDGITVAQGRVYVSTMDGKLQCFGK